MSMTSAILQKLDRVSNAIIEYIYPDVCFVCNNYAEMSAVLICDKCWEKLLRNSFYTVTAGEKYISGKRYFSFLAWRFSYNDNVRRLIHYFKFDNYLFLADRIGEEMADTANHIPRLQLANRIVPVPLHPARKRERGFDQSMLLAEVVARITEIPLEESLERIKYSPPQASIKESREKEKNVRGIIKEKHKNSLKGKRVILIDDLFTTGATANECSKILKKAGALDVMVLTAAYA